MKLSYSTAVAAGKMLQKMVYELPADYVYISVR